MSVALEKTSPANLYRDFDSKVAKETHKMSSGHGFEDKAVVPSLSARDEAKNVFSALAVEAELLPDDDPVLVILKAHVQEFISGRLSGIDTSYGRPARFVGTQTRIVDYVSRQDSRPNDERLHILLSRLSSMDEVWAGVRSILPLAPEAAVSDTGRACQVLSTVTSNVRSNLVNYYPGLDAGMQDALYRKLGELALKALAWKKETEATTGLTETSDAAAAQPLRERYKKILWRELGVRLEDLLEWHEREIVTTRAELLECAKDTGLGRVETLKDAFEILEKYGGPCDTVEEMFRRMKEYVSRAKDACKNGYVILPEETCVVRPTPEQTRDDFPWGGYGAGCWRRRPLIGEVFLNETNYKAVTDGWLKMMAIHECYPGHHAQFVRTTMDTLPETVKIGSRYVPLLEGTAHRSEKMMEHVFAEDPVYPLFVRLRRHHTAVRIKADLYLHYFGRPIEDAVELYMTELGFDRNSARGQVRYQERNPGYMTCYYYGMKRLADLQTRHGMADKPFTEALFSVGHLSVDGFEKYLGLSEDDKVRFRTCFGQ